ncbi:MAG: helix-turn-helix domain-containing protein [Eubacteriales bacterium]|nr:helix-turn-helix domain-containing protein [Eubacteriales bacterium]
MDEKFYSVDDISKMLNLHQKTLRRYIQSGKLRAGKVGKQYRISGHDLSVFLEDSGAAMLHTETADNKPNIPKVGVSAVVDISADDKDEADRITGALLAAANTKDPAYGKSTINIQHLNGGRKLRIMLWGSVRFIETMLGCVSIYGDEQEEL